MDNNPWKEKHKLHIHSGFVPGDTCQSPVLGEQNPKRKQKSSCTGETDWTLGQPKWLGLEGKKSQRKENRSISKNLHAIPFPTHLPISMLYKCRVKVQETKQKATAEKPRNWADILAGT